MNNTCICQKWHKIDHADYFKLDDDNTWWIKCLPDQFGRYCNFVIDTDDIVYESINYCPFCGEKFLNISERGILNEL